MTVGRLVAAGAVVVLVAVYAIGSGRWVATSGGWYQSLVQPSWQPPPVVFGLAWTYNFAVLVVVGLAMSFLAPTGRLLVFLGTLAVSIVLALAWAYLFYGPHQLTAAAVSLTACAAVTVALVVVAFAERWWLGVLLLPYLAWLATASALSWAYTGLNR